MSLTSCVLAVSVLCVTVCGSVQTEVVTRGPGAYTVPPKGDYVIKTYVSDPKIGTRLGEANVTPLIKLTPCAQAILGCCAPEVENQQHCFEQIGCGPHVFGNPCDKKYMNQALGGAERFYSQFIPNSTN